jgi:putative transposase
MEALMPLYKNCRLRTGRFSQRGGIYLLTAVVKHRTPLFRDFKLGRCVVAEMMNAQRWNQAQSLAWVVMPDHLHWLMQLEDASLETLMRQVKSRSSKAINERCATTGQLWQAGFHDRALRQEEDLLASARYIVANPLRAGLVKRVGDYPLWDAIWLQGYQASSSTPRP